MHRQPSFPSTNIKLTFKNLNKIQPIKQLNYKAFIKSLYHHFPLKPYNCYRLFYNNQQQTVTLRSQKDFEGFIKTSRQEGRLRLFIEETSNTSEHFVEGFEDYRQNMEVFEARLTDLKQHIQSELKRQREDMQKQLKEQYKQLLSKLTKPSKQSKSNQSDSIHEGITCSICSESNIKGVRYECAICNYHLCQNCESKNYKDPVNHPMIKIKYQWQKLTKKENQLGKKQPQKVKKTDLVSDLIELLHISESQAEALIKKHPKFSLNELAEVHFKASS